ncbi:spore cortex protein [Gracilibacillus halophilus YIM-C55.5]|uniref:Spore cortex protein n=1 Tax=Gracilibacillus halophilus YIM-C55.5 TaxID=1308866 RepID=N4WRG3_9BACI|nr:spore cortex protein [Gracilibacillus halophilus YIM-C55.5]
MSGSNILRGTMLLTGASFLSKFLGMIYVIPFTNIVGAEGMTLYSFAYTPYTILLSISTIGVPLAVSKFVAKYNALDDYQTSMNAFRLGVIIMFISGFIAFLSLYAGSGWIAELTYDERTPDISINDVQHVIKWVSFALILFPSMSVVRGFFQGHQSMAPTAVSQVIEQIVRISFLLVSVFLIKVIFDGSNQTAIGFATFAAFIGAIASWIVLLAYWRKRKPLLHQQITNQTKKFDISNQQISKELLQYAGPFILVGIAIPLYQLVDQFTFSHAMAEIGLEEISNIAYSSFNLQGHKLISIPITIATGLSLALMPEITKSFQVGNQHRLNEQVNQAFQMIMLLILPASIGLMLLSHEIYGGLFGLDHIHISGPLFAWYTPAALSFGFFTVSAYVLQGIEQQRFTLISLSTGILIKVLLNAVMIQTFHEKGAVITTVIASTIAVLLNIWKIKSSIEFPIRSFLKRIMLMLIFSVVMAITVIVVKSLFAIFIDYNDGRWQALVIAITATGLVDWLIYT